MKVRIDRAACTMGNDPKTTVSVEIIEEIAPGIERVTERLTLSWDLALKTAGEQRDAAQAALVDAGLIPADCLVTF